MATWLSALNLGGTSARGEDPLVNGLRQLGLRAAYGLLLSATSAVLMQHLAYFDADATRGWRDFFPLLFFVLALVSFPVSALVTAVVLGWAILYESPAAALWYVFMLLLIIGVYEDRKEHALLLAATPGLLLLNLGLLPTFLIGLFYGARRGLVNGFGCAAAIAIAAALGFAAFGSPVEGTAARGIVLTGLEFGEAPLVSKRLDAPKSILAVDWLDPFTAEGGALTWEGGSKEVSKFAERWALAISPVSLGLVLLWGFVAVAIHQSRQGTDLFLSRAGVPEWARGLLSQGIALVAGVVLFVVGYGFILSGRFGMTPPPGLGEAFGAQLRNAAFLTFVIIVAVNAFRVFVAERPFAWPPRWAPRLLALLQRLNIQGLRPRQPAE